MVSSLQEASFHCQAWRLALESADKMAAPLTPGCQLCTSMAVLEVSASCPECVNRGVGSDRDPAHHPHQLHHHVTCVRTHTHLESHLTMWQC